MALDFDVDELAPKVTIQGATDIDNDDEFALEVTIQWNLKMFLPYICDCVSATDLLTFLHFYTKEQRKEIFQLSTSQPHTATKKALEILRDNVQEPGRFTALKECMDFCKYPKISEILLGKHVPDDLNYQSIVDLFSSELIGRLQPSELLPLLRRYEVVQLEECEKIRAEEMNNGSRRACWLMLYYLPCRHKNWFKYFLRTLIECNFGDLAEKLDPDLYEKLVAQERSEEGASGSTADESMSLVYGAGQSTSILVNTVSDHQAAENKEDVVIPDAVFDKIVHDIDDIVEKADLEETRENNNGDVKQPELEDFSCLLDTDNEVTEQSMVSKQIIRYSRELLLELQNSPFADYTPLDVLKIPGIRPTFQLPRKPPKTTLNHLNQPDFIAIRPNKKKVIKYSCEFLLQLRYSPFAQYTPVEASKFPEITLQLLRKQPEKNLSRRDLKIKSKKCEPSKLTNSPAKSTSSEELTGRKALDDDHTEPKQVADINEGATQAISEVTANPASDIGEGLDNNLEPVQQIEENTKSVIIHQRLKGVDKGGDGAEDIADIIGDVHESDASPMETEPKAIYKRVRMLDKGIDEDVADKLSESAVRDMETEPKVLHERVKVIDEGTVIDEGLEAQHEHHNDDLEDEFRKLLLEDIKTDNDQNDLSGESTVSDPNTDEYNIKTDEDELGDEEDKDIDLRNYQRELAREGREGDNVIIMAPTNSGKTRVGCAIIQSHLRQRKQHEQITRVIFIVENEALALQQGKVFEEQLPAYRTKVITGSIQRDKQQYLKDFVMRRDILVVTAMVLVNTLRDKEIDSLSTFTMIMFDECHHTNGCHPYNQIMSKYMDIKLNKNMGRHLRPQIVGLTASIGVGGTLDLVSAMNHMKKIMSNMDAAYLCTVRQNVAELKKYENPPIEETVQVPRRRDDVFRNKLDQCMNAIDNFISSHPTILALGERYEGLIEVCKVPSCHGTEQFIQWLSEFKKTIAKFSSKEVIRMLNPCREHLQVYNKALMIHRDARVKEAREILDVYMNEQIHENPVKDETDNRLLEIYKSVDDIEYDNIPENPKLVRLQELMMQVLGHNPDARGIIFVKTRELARALINWTKETPELAPLNADYFVGAVAAASAGGMTKCGQKDVLEYFKGGKHKLIIATSVAEEGLDIAKCNLVIRYEHVTNEIVRLQSRGRARAEDSKYFVVTEEGSWIAAKEEKNQLLEELMNQLVPVVQRQIETDQQQWQREMREMQKEAKEKERLKQKEMEDKMNAGRWQLQCFNCTKFICWSTGVKQIQNAHHVVIDDTVKDRIVTVRNPYPLFEESELKFDGDVFCLECVYRLGGVCEYKRVEFPLLKVKLIRFAPENSAHGFTEKKWKKVPFYVEKFTLEDLTVVAERKLEELGDDI